MSTDEIENMAFFFRHHPNPYSPYNIYFNRMLAEYNFQCSSIEDARRIILFNIYQKQKNDDDFLCTADGFIEADNIMQKDIYRTVVAGGILFLHNDEAYYIYLFTFQGRIKEEEPYKTVYCLHTTKI